MLNRLWILAEREVTTYTSTLTFWIALLIGPVAMAVAAAAITVASRPAPPVTISVGAQDSWLQDRALAALKDLAVTEKATVVLSRTPAPTSYAFTATSSGENAQIDEEGPTTLSPLAREYILTRLERDALATKLGAPLARLHATKTGKTPNANPQGARISKRLPLVIMLWLTLTGSLGMLVQAVARERANKGLEQLLASASPLEIVSGKVIGVGVVSLLIALAWVAASMVISFANPVAEASIRSLNFSKISGGDAAIAIGIYILAYFQFGFATAALSAAASDLTAAQNLSRPIFAVLLAVFFVVVAAGVSPTGNLNWLLFAPPFTPFMLLLSPQASWGAAVAVILMIVTTVLAAKFATEMTALKPGSKNLYGRSRTAPPRERH